jgi:hypothetical protein
MLLCTVPVCRGFNQVDRIELILLSAVVHAMAPQNCELMKNQFFHGKIKLGFPMLSIAMNIFPNLLLENPRKSLHFSIFQIDGSKFCGENESKYFDPFWLTQKDAKQKETSWF